MKKVFSLKVILPIISGIIVCGMLCFFGIISEAPGICVLGVSAGFILFMLGIKNSGTIRKGLLLPASLLFFAVLFSFCTTRILINGEFGSPWHSVFGYAVSGILLMIGLGMIYPKNKR